MRTFRDWMGITHDYHSAQLRYIEQFDSEADLRFQRAMEKDEAVRALKAGGQDPMLHETRTANLINIFHNNTGRKPWHG